MIRDFEQMPSAVSMSQASCFDDVREVLALILAHKLRIDPQYAGELRAMFENAGTRINYYSASGVTIDTMSELLFGEHFTSRQLDGSETLEFLSMVFAPRPRVHKPRARMAKAEVDPALRHARVTRNRKYTCDTCGQRISGTRSTAAICATCFDGWLARLPEDIQEHVGNAIARFRFVRRDLLPEEIEAEIMNRAAEAVA